MMDDHDIALRLRVLEIAFGKDGWLGRTSGEQTVREADAIFRWIKNGSLPQDGSDAVGSELIHDNTEGDFKSPPDFVNDGRAAGLDEQMPSQSGGGLHGRALDMLGEQKKTERHDENSAGGCDDPSVAGRSRVSNDLAPDAP